MELFDAMPLAALIHFKPLSYIIRVGVAVAAFHSATNIESAFRRTLGLVFLILIGGGFLIAGMIHGTIIDILLGLAGIGAACYSWWFTRH